MRQKNGTRKILLALLILTPVALVAIPVGGTDVSLKGDVNFRYIDNDGDTVGDSAASELRIRLFVGAKLTESFSTNAVLYVTSNPPNTIAEIGSSLGGSMVAGPAYVTWHNPWGDLKVGRLHAKMIGNNLVDNTDIFHQFQLGVFHGAFASFNDFNRWDLDFYLRESNGVGATDEGLAWGLTVGLDEMLGNKVHFGTISYDSDYALPGNYPAALAATYDGFRAFYAGASIGLSDITDLNLEWISGSQDNLGGGSTEGTALLSRLVYPLGDDLSLGVAYGTMEPGATIDGLFGEAVAGNPASMDGDMLRFDLRWKNWTFSFINWEDDLAAQQDTVLRAEYHIKF
ncbi:hypothetical protein H8D30_03315 [bacterium]|nr:hypothetical protein [bacterium]